MSNPREEILRLTTERLQNKVESIMLEINLLLSNPERAESAVNKTVDMLRELAIVESSLNLSRNLYNQCLSLKLKEMADSLENEPKKTEE